MSLVLAVLVASLLGSIHCAGMCGGFVCFYAGGAADGGPAARGHVAYHVGRLASYLALGLVGGAAGGRIEHVAGLVGVQRGAAVIAGALMIAWGAARVAGTLGWSPVALGTPLMLQRRLGAAIRRLAHWPLATRSAALGLVTALLPCGWLWAFVVTAAGTGSAITGALVMVTFWAGTLPMLTALGVGVQKLAGPLRRRLPLVSGAVMVALGFLALAGKMRVGPSHLHDAHVAIHDHR